MATQPDLTPDLARAARALTQVSLTHLAARAGVSKETLRGFERHSASLTDDEKERLVDALLFFGVVLFPDDDRGGYGVRRKFSASKVKRLEVWEGEGGPVAEDDI
ncbi:hypothetical protein [Pseudactinotalea sp.]|uniref:hypothetical protein n=1 Tax=Pseudactinotalea sp. TaxID=1926260 RepID=UPI003B3BDC33